jgi:hypothetical protein
VRDDQKRHAQLVLQADQLELRVLTQLLVERAQGLIEQQQLGPLDQRARERHALLLAAGQLVRLALGEAAELHEFQHGGHALGDLRLRHAVLLQAEGDILLDVHVRKQRVGLEHHVHGPLVRRHARHVLAVDQNAAGTRCFEAAEHAQQRGLAAAGRSQQAENLALIDLQADVIDRLEIAERFGDAFDLHIGAGGRIPPQRGLGCFTGVGHAYCPVLNFCHTRVMARV